VWVEVYLPLVAMLAVLFGLRRLIDTTFARSCAASTRTTAPCSAAVPTLLYKIQALFVGSLVASFAGAYMVHYIQIAGMSLFALDYSHPAGNLRDCRGVGNFAGAVLGACLLVPISEFMAYLWRLAHGFLLYNTDGLRGGDS